MDTFKQYLLSRHIAAERQPPYYLHGIDQLSALTARPNMQGIIGSPIKGRVNGRLKPTRFMQVSDLESLKAAALRG